MNRGKVLINLIVMTVIVVTLVVRPDFIAALVGLIFLGMVPGTDITLPWWVIIGSMIIALVAAIRWVFDEPVYRPYATPKDLSRRSSARRKVLRRTRTTVVAQDITPAASAARVKI